LSNQPRRGARRQSAVATTLKLSLDGLLNRRVKQFWLVKQEPSAYSWTDFVADGKTTWTGVRNFTARNNLRAMRKGDTVLYYHSVTDKAVFGIAKVIREAYPDPTATEGDWTAVDLAPEKALATPVSLDEIKRNPKLKEMALLRLSRLSVQPVTASQFKEILRMGGSRAPSRDV
jgi:predicted RNA-binding protein with PUA-like domain